MAANKKWDGGIAKIIVLNNHTTLVSSIVVDSDVFRLPDAGGGDGDGGLCRGAGHAGAEQRPQRAQEWQVEGETRGDAEAGRGSGGRTSITGASAQAASVREQEPGDHHQGRAEGEQREPGRQDGRGGGGGEGGAGQGQARGERNQV